MELSIRKLHLINDHRVHRRVVDSFDPNDWIIVCTIRTIDLSIRKLHTLPAKSENGRHNTEPIINTTRKTWTRGKTLTTFVPETKQNLLARKKLCPREGGEYKVRLTPSTRNMKSEPVEN